MSAPGKIFFYIFISEVRERKNLLLLHDILAGNKEGIRQIGKADRKKDKELSKTEIEKEKGKERGGVEMVFSLSAARDLS